MLEKQYVELILNKAELENWQVRSTDSYGEEFETMAWNPD